MKILASVLITVFCVVSSISAINYDLFIRKQKETSPLLRSFETLQYDVVRGPDGTYRFHFHVGDSSRTEERDSSGFVKGKYAFVAPEGNEYEFKYEADKEGYRVDSDALPTNPEETDDVKKAKEIFFDEYNKALERANEADDDDDEDDDEESSEEADDNHSSQEENEETPSYAVFAYRFGNRIYDQEEEEDNHSSHESSEEEDYDAEQESVDENKERGLPSNHASSLAHSHFGRRAQPLPYRRNNI